IRSTAGLNFTSTSVGPLPAGTFVVYRNRSTGHVGVLRVDEINLRLSGEWWFQSDGTADFSRLRPVADVAPTPAIGIRATGTGSLVLSWSEDQTHIFTMETALQIVPAPAWTAVSSGAAPTFFPDGKIV